MAKKPSASKLKKSSDKLLATYMLENPEIAIILQQAIDAAQKPTCNPQEGHERYFVHCRKLCIYTSMGANNLHHASNKATKLWGPNWSNVTQDQGLFKEHKFVVAKQFGLLLRTLQI